MADETIETPATQDNTNEPASTEPAVTPGLMGATTPEVAPETDVKADAEPSEEGAQPEVAPEVYEQFTLTEGYEMNESDHEAFSEVVKGLNLTQKQAQALVDFDIKRSKEIGVVNEEAQAAEQEAFKVATVEGWKTEINKRLGDKASEKIDTGTKAFDRFAPESLKEAYAKSGMNFDPDFVEMMIAVGDSMSEDTLVTGGHAVKGKNEGGLVDMFSDLNKT